MPDLGLTVGVGFRTGPLARVSPRALQLYLHLASRAAHGSRGQDVSGQVVRVAVGEVLASQRAMREWLGCGSSQVVTALDELSHAALIGVTAISKTAKALPNRERATLPNQERQQHENTLPNRERVRPGNRLGTRIVVSRIKLNGFNALRENDNAPNLGTISNRAKTGRPTASTELAWINRQLAAEDQ